MRPMNITGVTNNNLSVVQESMGSTQLYALSKALLCQSISDCISKDILQFNDFYC